MLMSKSSGSVMMMQERAVWLSSKGKPRKQITFSSLLTRRNANADMKLTTLVAR